MLQVECHQPLKVLVEVELAPSFLGRLPLLLDLDLHSLELLVELPSLVLVAVQLAPAQR